MSTITFGTCEEMRLLDCGSNKNNEAANFKQTNLISCQTGLKIR